MMTSAFTVLHADVLGDSATRSLRRVVARDPAVARAINQGLNYLGMG